MWTTREEGMKFIEKTLIGKTIEVEDEKGHLLKIKILEVEFMPDEYQWEDIPDDEIPISISGIDWKRKWYSSYTVRFLQREHLALADIVVARR